MNIRKQLKILKDTDPVKYRELRDKLNERDREYHKNKYKLSEAQKEAKRARARRYYNEKRKPYLDQLKKDNYEQWKKETDRTRYYYRKLIESDDPKDKEKAEKIRQSKMNYYHKEKITNIGNEEKTGKRQMPYDKRLNLDVSEYFIKELVKKTRTHLVVNESKKLVERALNAYNYWNICGNWPRFSW